ncbi:MAG TPA: SIR2 family protein [Thermoanaerobaculia bacterium]|nr:SIR2 family protein [Thermoanaerobaculia bacterium]
MPFLGAGVNASSGSYQGLPLGGEVATRLVEKLIGQKIQSLGELVTVQAHACLQQWDYSQDLARIGLENLARVALHIELSNDSNYLVSLLMEVIPDKSCSPSPLLQALARLPLKLIVTTNYDRLLERALEDADTSFVSIVQPLGGFSPNEQREVQELLVSSDCLVVYKIHGSFTDEGQGVSAPVIITEEDYIEFLTVIGQDKVGVPSLVAEKMVDSTLLFLGYSLEDWDFRTLFKGLVEKLPPRKRRRSIAIQKSPSPFWMEFWREKGVVIYDADLHGFALDLEEKFLADARRL